MGIIKTEGLKGLQGLSALSEAEKADFMKSNITSGILSSNASYASHDRVYRNNLFIDKFGIEKFNSLSSQDRDALYEKALVDEAIQVYKDDKNFPTINTLTTTSKKFLLESGYLTDAEFEDEQNRKLKQAAETDNSSGFSFFETFTNLMEPGLAGGKAIALDGKGSHGYGKSSETNQAIIESGYTAEQEARNKVLENLVHKDNAHKVEMSSGLSAVLYDDLQSKLDTWAIKPHEVSQLFESIAEFSPHYNAFKNSEEMSNFGLSDQMKAIADFMAVSKIFDEASAVGALSDQIQNYISDNQDALDWTGNTSKRVLLKGVANLANKVLGAEAMIKGMDDEALSLFLQGKDDDGNDLPWYNNPLYWQGVDQFNTFDSNEIKRAQENGGISKYQNITKAGEEMEFFSWTILNEAVGQLGYLWSEILASRVMGSAGKGLGKVMPKLTTSKFGKITGTLLDIGQSTLGMAEAEGLSAFQESLRQMQEVINGRIDSDIQTAINEYSKTQEYANEVDTVLNNLRKYQSKETDEELKKQAISLVQKQLYDRFKPEIEAKYEDDIIQAGKSATSAYMTTASIFAVKEGITNGLFQRFLFNKGTRQTLGDNGPKVNVTNNADGTISTSISTWNKYVKPIIGNSITEFAEEVSDNVVNNFGQGFGLNDYLSYHNKKYNPEAYVESTDGIVGNIIGGFNKAKESLTKKDAYYEGFIGAVSGVGGGAVQAFQNREFAKDLESRTSIINEILKENGSTLQDIAGIMSTMHEFDVSVAKGNTLNALDAKQRQAFDLINTISTLGKDAVGSQSNLYQEAMQTIENLASGKLETEKLDDLATQFLGQPNNKAIASSNNAKEQAIKQLRDNAKNLIDMRDNVIEFYNSIDNIPNKGTLTPEVKTELAYLKVMGKNWKERLDSIEKSVGSSNGSFSADAEYGSKKAYERKKEAVSSSIQKMKDKVKGIKELIDTKDKKKDKVAISALKLEEKALLSNIKKAEQEYKKLEKHAELFEDSNYSRTLSKEEILSLPASQRAWMLNPDNISDYSSEQQIVIEELKSELTTKDPTLLQQIQDAAVLSSRIEEVNTAFSRILNNPEEAFHYINALKDYRNSKLQSLYQQKYDDKVAEAIDGKSDEEAKAIARNLPYSAVNRYIEKNPDKKDLLSGVMEVSKLREDAVYASLPLLESGDTEAVKAINGIITDITKNSNNRTEAINAIEEAIDDESINGDTRSLLDEVLNKLQELDYQRNATKVENRAAKKAREEEKESKAKKQEEVKKAAEKSVQDDNKNKEFEVNKDGSNIITEEDPGIKSDGSNVQETIEVDESKTGSEAEWKSSEGEVDLDGKIADLTAEEQVKNNPKARITNTINESSEGGTPTSLVGNVMARYNSTLLKEEKYQERRKGKEENDPMNQFFSWMDAAGINYQEIIDNELSDIWALDPDINFLMVNPQDNATNDKSMNDHVLLVVEYTPEVANIHKESRGGVLNANGKRWLVVGTLGFGEYKDQQEAYGTLKYELKKRRFQYMNSNPGERFYVDSFYSTKIESIDAGLITRKLEEDSEVKVRKISELLNEESRNPRGIESLSDLKWGIQTDTEFVTVNTSSRDRVHSPMNSLDNSGNTFILIEAANGDYIPIAVKPIMYNELQDGRLKTQIDDLLLQLTSPDYPERLAAIRKLRHLLVLTDDKNILIGNEEYNTLTVVDNNNKKTFNLDDPLLNRKDFIDSILGVKFRINITTSSLSSPTSLEILDEANCLNTDIAKLGTSNAGFSVYSVGTDGKPKITDSTPINYTIGNSPNTRETSVIILGQVYRKKKDSWIDTKDNLVTDPRLLDQIKYNHIIQSRELEPIESSKTYDYFVINQDINNPIVVKQNRKDHTIVIPSKDQAIEYINRMAKKEAAKKAQEAINKAIVNEESLVDVNLEDEVVTQDELFDSMTGKYTEETEDKKSEPEPLVQNTVDDINKTGTKSLAELQANKTLDSFIGILSDSKFGAELDSIIDEKIESGAWSNVPDDMNQLSKYLEEKGIPITGITDVTSWLDMIKNCK